MSMVRDQGTDTQLERTSRGGAISGVPRGISFLLARKIFLGLVGIAILIGIWYWIAANTKPIFLPSPTIVWEQTAQNFFHNIALAFVAFGTGGIYHNLLYTSANVIMGVTIGAVIGVIIGVLIGRIPLCRDALEPPLLFLGTVPDLVLLPFLSLWVGNSRLATSGLVIFYTFVIVAMGTQVATTNISGYFEQYSDSLGASKKMLLMSVIAPAIVPEIIGTIRVALAFGWGFQAIAEVLGGQVGAGRLIRVFTQYSNTAAMLSTVVCLGLIAIVADGIIATVGKWAVRWKE